MKWDVDESIVVGMQQAAVAAGVKKRPRCLEIANHVIRVFLRMEVCGPESLVVVHALLHQLATMSTDQLRIATANDPEFSVQRVHMGHVLAALGLLSGYPTSAVAGLIENAPVVERKHPKAN